MYETTAEGIRVKVKLFKDLKGLVELEVDPSDDPDRLVRNIVREMKKKWNK